jgi:hypothetical protein
MSIFRRATLLVMGALQVFGLLAVLTKPAHAYVDPGSGLLFFQVAGSMLAGALFVLRSKLRKIFGLSSKVDKTAIEGSSKDSETTV